MQIFRAKIKNSEAWIFGLCKAKIKDKSFKVYIKNKKSCYEIDRDTICMVA